MRLSEHSMLMVMFGHERDEVASGFTEFADEQLHNLITLSYYYYYYYYYRLPSHAFSPRYFSWTSCDPHRSRFKLHNAVLSVLCVMFQVQLSFVVNLSSVFPVQIQNFSLSFSLLFQWLQLLLVQSYISGSTFVVSLYINSCILTNYYYYYYYYYYTIYMSPVTGPFSPVLVLNQRWSPLLTLQASHCSTFRIMCDVPSVAGFCGESIECFHGTAYYYYYYYYYCGCCIDESWERSRRMKNIRNY